MPRPIFAHVRAILLLGLALSASFLAPSPALAQEDCEIPLPGHQLTKPLCNFDPMVTLSPGDVYVSQPWVPVRVEAWDYLEYLDTASFAVRVDGVDVTGTFGRTTRFEGAPPITRWHRTAVGLVGLSESDPVREVSASLCDTYQGMQLCTTREAEYRLSLPGVEVSPKGGTNHSLASQGIARTFTVTNRGTLEATFALTPQCVELRTGEAVTPCTLDVATVTLSPGGSQVVNLSHGMQVGDELRVTVEASAVGQPGVRDSGWRVVSVFGAGGARLAPEVAVVELGGGAWVERSACVTVAVGPAAAYECGDLRVGHGLPVHRTHGRTWAPALLFNSAHVVPRPTLHLDVGVPEGGDVPERVTVAVTVGETTHTRHFAGSDWRPGMTRRVGVQWEDASLVTGLHAYALEVTSEYPGETRTTTTGGEFAVVNRGGSGFGPGWWLAGYERLHQTGGNRFLLVGGDGSTRVFTPQVIGSEVVWTAPRATGAADTLRQLAAPDTGYWRRLPGGGEIHYDGFGWQKKTINRLGQVTTFAREPVHGHLISITATTRFVWAGDQLLWELKTPSEAATWETEGPSAAYGQVSYFHAGGIDRPLVITKGSESVIPHQNWRGQFARGTYADGRSSDCESSQATGCTPVQWPGYRTTAWHVGANESSIQNWFGGLVDGMRDASGQMYMRNRYYDPATGQFTQPDPPIGIAGGLNVYGFAAGDPVSYSDPYGLCPFELTGRPCTALHGLAAGTGAVLGGLLGAGGGAVAGTVVLPGAGTVGGGGLGAVVGSAEGAILGLAVANLAEVAVEGASEFASRGVEQIRKWSSILVSALSLNAANPDGPEPPPRPITPPPPTATTQSSGTGPRPNPDPLSLRVLQ